jgi:hypothetical protein
VHPKIDTNRAHDTIIPTPHKKKLIKKLLCITMMVIGIHVPSLTPHKKVRVGLMFLWIFVCPLQFFFFAGCSPSQTTMLLFGFPHLMSWIML